MFQTITVSRSSLTSSQSHDLVDHDFPRDFFRERDSDITSGTGSGGSLLEEGSGRSTPPDIIISQQ